MKRSVQRSISFAIALIAYVMALIWPAFAASERVLYAFAGGNDGANTYSTLVDVSGTLYGTTPMGGGTGCNGNGCGTVFSITPAGVEKIVYAFAGGADGEYPASNKLVKFKDVLYGTAYGGLTTGCPDSPGCGIVFSLTTAGIKQLVYAFKGGKNGYGPAGLILRDGALYGPTYDGGGTGCGGNGCGTIFRLTLPGKEHIIYNFGSGADGAGPFDLSFADGLFYGTTATTVFSLTPSGTASVLLTPSSFPDSVVEVNGTLYGATAEGGTSGSCGFAGCGTVYAFTPGSGEQILHEFGNASDGRYPGGLIYANGLLFGTTSEGGGDGCNGSGCGTVFSISPSGTETILYSFRGGKDGAYPHGLIYYSGKLFGTTINGGGTGCGGNGCGTIFIVKP